MHHEPDEPTHETQKTIFSYCVGWRGRVGDCPIHNVAMERHNNRYIFGGFGYSVRGSISVFPTGESMTPQIKMALAVAWALVCFGTGVTAGYKWQELRYVERENELQAEHLEQLKAERTAAAAQIEATETARAKLQKSIEAAKNDNAKLSSDLNSGRKWLRVLVQRQQACGTGGTTDELAEVAPDVRQDILDFREAVIEHDARMEFLEVTCRGRYAPF